MHLFETTTAGISFVGSEARGWKAGNSHLTEGHGAQEPIVFPWMHG